MKLFLAAKLHNIHVTDKSVDYHGSVSICKNLLQASGIEPYEQVQIVNLNNGQRWITYAISGEVEDFRLNGGGARLGEIGDRCVVMTYRYLDSAVNIPVIYCDEHNKIGSQFNYENP